MQHPADGDDLGLRYGTLGEKRQVELSRLELRAGHGRRMVDVHGGPKVVQDDAEPVGAAQIAQGGVKEACATWTSALDAMEDGIHSGRARQRVVDMRHLLSP
ncbi:hypothetical protein ACFWQ6_32220 [Streptomyces coelicoflavus]|uniref:hypothetical protein n=1 Tax=Streptomyces coelicoflavus TaxID=285562 RepID=UPI00365BFFAF